MKLQIGAVEDTPVVTMNVVMLIGVVRTCNEVVLVLAHLSSQRYVRRCGEPHSYQLPIIAGAASPSAERPRHSARLYAPESALSDKHDLRPLFSKITSSSQRSARVSNAISHLALRIRGVAPGQRHLSKRFHASPNTSVASDQTPNRSSNTCRFAICAPILHVPGCDRPVAVANCCSCEKYCAPCRGAATAW